MRREVNLNFGYFLPLIRTYFEPEKSKVLLSNCNCVGVSSLLKKITVLPYAAASKRNL